MIFRGEPTGKKTTIGNNIEAYIAEASGKTIHKETALFIVPDVIGIWQNSQLIADQFGANGKKRGEYHTILYHKSDRLSRLLYSSP